MKTNKKLTSKWSLKKPLYVTPKDTRYKKHLKQLKKQGFSDSETWSLRDVIAEFILPRLNRFKEITISIPMSYSENQWNNMLDDMIFAFEWVLSEGECDDKYMSLNDKEIDNAWKRYKKGMGLFAENFMTLWW